MNKEKIALLVDSGTDVPEALVKQYGMYVLPLQIIYPEKTYTDKVDITPEEVYQRLEKEIPSTSLPDGATIQAIFDKIKEAGYEKVLAVTISSGLSGTYNVVRLLGEQTEGLDVFRRHHAAGEVCRTFDAAVSTATTFNQVIFTIPTA